MAQKTAFQAFLDEEVNKVKGVYYPVKVGFLRRVLTKKTAMKKLHPNPNDEFCFPEIGPNYEIISNYEKDYRALLNNMSSVDFLQGGIKEPLMVEKTRPDGYMILNGHHRWAAALRVGLDRIKIRIVDLTQASDIRKMVKAGASDKRATLDLDEVVFRPEGFPYLEPPLGFPYGRFYRERLRRGIPSLFNTLERNGFDIWIYTRNYYSLQYLQYYFKHYHVHVTGIVTGTARKTGDDASVRRELETLINNKYKTTLHIDNEAVIRSYTGSKDFDEFRVTGAEETWSREVAEIFEEMKKNG